jgi:hypothetical protein
MQFCFREFWHSGEPLEGRTHWTDLNRIKVPNMSGNVHKSAAGEQHVTADDGLKVAARPKLRTSGISCLFHFTRAAVSRRVSGRERNSSRYMALPALAECMAAQKPLQRKPDRTPASRIVRRSRGLSHGFQR